MVCSSNKIAAGFGGSERLKAPKKHKLVAWPCKTLGPSSKEEVDILCGV